MTERQDTKFIKSSRRLTAGRRIAALAVFVGLAGGGAVLWLASRGVIDMHFWLGVCGFRQRFGLPCPGCGWTRATQAFLNGHPVQAFLLQPAAAIFCAAAAVTAVFALLMAVFGIEFGSLRRILGAVGLKWLLLAAAVVVLSGWGVTLIRAMVHNNGM